VYLRVKRHAGSAGSAGSAVGRGAGAEGRELAETLRLEVTVKAQLAATAAAQLAGTAQVTKFVKISQVFIAIQ